MSQFEGIFFGPKTELKSAKMRDLIEDGIRRKWAGFKKVKEGDWIIRK
jgi:hypothetical protein